jgi:hypothetical protein
VIDRPLPVAVQAIPGRRRLVIAGLIGALTVATWIALSSYQPLEQGSSSGGPDPYLLSSVTSPFGDGTMQTFCHDPGEVGHTIGTLRNTGPLAVTVIGPASKPDDPIQLIELGGMRPLNADGTPDMSRLIDVSHAEPMQPTRLDPGQEVELWLAFRLPSVPMSPGGAMWTRTVPVRVSILGIERDLAVLMHDGYGFSGDPCTGR